MMRIVLHSRYPKSEDQPRGGVETATLNLLRGLRLIGQTDLHVVTLEAGLNSPVVEQRALATVHRLPKSNWPMFLDIFAGPGRSRLAGYIESLKPDIAHFHETHGLGLSGIAVPSIFTVHGFDSLNLPTEKQKFWRLRSRLWKIAEDIGLKRQSHIISIAGYVTQQINCRDSAKIFEIHNAIQEENFHVARDPILGRVFYAGWINPRKNALGLVRAFATVARESATAELRLAGEFSDPGYKDLVEALIRETDLGNRVTLLGRISSQEVQEELSRASVFVLPSYQENAPMVVSEAMAAGVPVVTSNVCGMPDMIEDKKTGFLFDPDDTDGFAAAILNLLNSEKTAQSISRNAKDAAREKFHPQVVAEKTIDAYQHVIDDFRLELSTAASA
jgi:glycosyltransferase involved in cell wall biosynthesis